MTTSSRAEPKRLGERGDRGQLARGHDLVDARDVLVHDATGAEVHGRSSCPSARRAGRRPGRGRIPPRRRHGVGPPGSNKRVGLATKAEQAPTVTASTDKQRMM